MSTSGETADLMVREGIQITESALKLAGLGAKNLAALLIALANDNQKVAGKTTLKRLIQDREELTIFSISEQDLAAFKKEGTVEIMAKAKDARQINRILERMGIAVPTRQEDEAAKKEVSRVPSGEKSREYGTDTRAATETMDSDPNQRPSVRKKMEELKAQQAQREKGQPQREKGAPVFHHAKNGKKTKGGLER